jgi:hypothetical protein
MSGWVVLALNIGLVANSVAIVLLARAQSHHGAPRAHRDRGDRTSPAFVITRPQVATGLFRETVHECCPPVLTARGKFRFRCPVCHSEFTKATGEFWELAQRHGVQWAAVDGGTDTSDKPRPPLICTDADHYPDCGHGRPS